MLATILAVAFLTGRESRSDIYPNLALVTRPTLRGRGRQRGNVTVSKTISSWNKPDRWCATLRLKCYHAFINHELEAASWGRRTPKNKTSFWPESFGSVRCIIVLSHIVFVARCFDPHIDPHVFAACCHHVRILLWLDLRQFPTLPAYSSNCSRLPKREIWAEWAIQRQRFWCKGCA